jgi:hypothetical protein
MAFTTEQKDTIRKRAEELVASEGISTGTAAQRAIKELFTPEQISDAFTVKPPMRFTSLPPAPLPSLMDKLEVPAPPKPQTVSPVQETRPPEIIKVDTELEEAETKYRLNRISQLKEQGLSAEAADEQIKKELLSFREPVPLGFGDIAERREGGGASALRASLEGLGIPGPRETVKKHLKCSVIFLIKLKTNQHTLRRLSSFLQEILGLEHLKSK